MARKANETSVKSKKADKADKKKEDMNLLGLSVIILGFVFFILSLNNRVFLVPAIVFFIIGSALSGASIAYNTKSKKK